MLRAEDYVRVQKDGGLVSLNHKKDRRICPSVFFLFPLLGDELINNVADLLGRGRGGR